MADYLELAARGRTAWWRWLLAGFVALVMWLLLCIVMIAGLEITRLLPADISQILTDPRHVRIFFGATGALFGGLTLCFALATRWLQGKRFTDITGPWRWRRFLTGLTVWLVVCVLAAGLDLAIEPAGFRESLGPRTAELVLWSAPSLFIQTFTEEFIFRGYVTQGWLLATRRPLAAALLSGVLFAALHIPNGWPQAASALAFGVVTALIAIRTGSIAFTFGMHLANNLFGAFVVVSANDVFRGAPALFTQSTPNLMWLDAAVPFFALAVALWFAGVRPGEASA